MTLLIMALCIIAIFLVGMICVVDYIDKSNEKRDDELRKLYMNMSKEELEKMVLIEELMNR